MAEVAAEASVSLTDAFAVFPSTEAIIDAVFERVDRRMLADAAPDLSESARDRLFEVIMTRFDALVPYKPAVAAYFRELPADPLGMPMKGLRFGQRLARMLEAAGLSSTGALGALRVQGLAVIYLSTLRVWIEDESADMAKTMATLDRALRRAESVMRSVSSLPPCVLKPPGRHAAAERETPEPAATASSDRQA